MIIIIRILWRRKFLYSSHFSFFLLFFISFQNKQKIFKESIFTFNFNTKKTIKIQICKSLNHRKIYYNYKKVNFSIVALHITALYN